MTFHLYAAFDRVMKTLVLVSKPTKVTRPKEAVPTTDKLAPLHFVLSGDSNSTLMCLDGILKKYDLCT